MRRLFNVTSYDRTATETVLLFPGQGAYDEAALAAARPALVGVRDVFERIDRVAMRMQPSAARVCDTVLDPSPPSLAKLCASEPDLLQLALFGLSVAVYESMTSAGVRPRALIGHSLGEIAALVCGGMFTLEQGAEIVCHRNAALRLVADQPGAMAAVGCSAERSQALLAFLQQDGLSVAADNSPRQSVISGPDAGLALAEKVAQAAAVTFVRLKSPYAFHSPIMEPVAKAFADSLRHLSPGELAVPVYSPILGRWYESGDSMPELLASHLLEPVRFGDAVRQLWDGGARVFVECGAKSALTGLVGQSIPEATKVTCLDGVHAGAFPREQVATLRELGQVSAELDDRLAEFVLPGVPVAEAQTFWDTCGTDVLEEIRRRYDAFVRQDERPVAEVPPVPVAAVANATPFDRDGLFDELAAFYAEALEYPVEVMTEDAELEADLGVDSVKQTELIARVAKEYGLPERPEDFRLSDYPTLGRVVDFVNSATENRALAA